MPELIWIFMALGASVLWGLVYTLDKRVLDFLSVGELYFLYYLASTVICFFLLPKGTTPTGLWDKIKTPDRLPWVVVTIIISFAANYLIGRSIQLSNATVAALIEVSYPLFTVLFSFLLLNTVTLNLHVAIGGTLVIAGVMYIGLFAH